MTWGAVGGAAIGAAGSYFGNKQDSHANDPVTPEMMYMGAAQPGVQDVMRQAGNLQMQQYYPGSTIAPQADMYAGALSNLYNNPMAAQYQGSMAGMGMDAMAGMQNAMANPNQQFQFGQGTFDQTMANLMPALQGSYDAATRDNNRNLNWNQLPGLNLGGSQNGAQGSTKLGQQSALMQATNMDRNADIGASMYQNAVNQAQQAGMSAGAQNLNAQQNMYGIGANALNNAFNMNQTGLQNQYMAGSAQQQYDQSLLTDDVNRFNFNQAAPYNLLQDKMSIYNAGRMDNPQASGPSQGINTWEAITQGANMGLNFYDGWKNASTPQLQPFDTSQYASMYKKQ
jgi:hypothetical protein